MATRSEEDMDYKGVMDPANHEVFHGHITSTRTFLILTL